MLTAIAGGGAPTIPGLSGDDATPPGIIVLGAISADGGKVATDGNGILTTDNQFFAADAFGSSATVSPGGVQVVQGSDIGNALVVQVASGAVGQYIALIDHTLAAQWAVYADGSIHSKKAIAVNGKADPGYPVLATGAGHTVDDVITLLQAVGLCKQA